MCTVPPTNSYIHKPDQSFHIFARVKFSTSIHFQTEWSCYLINHYSFNEFQKKQPSIILVIRSAFIDDVLISETNIIILYPPVSICRQKS